MPRSNSDIKDYPPQLDLSECNKQYNNKTNPVVNELMTPALHKVVVDLGLSENNFIDAVSLIGQGKIGSTARKYYCRKYEGAVVNKE